MMFEQYPDVLTVEEVCEALRCKFRPNGVNLSLRAV